MSSEAITLTGTWRRAKSSFLKVGTCEAFILIVICIGVSVLCEDWIAGLAVFVLWVGWHWLPRAEGQFAFTFQWLQVVVGILYYGFTGRRLEAMDQSDYRPMVLLGLACLVALFGGVALGTRALGQHQRGQPGKPSNAFASNELVLLYLASLVSGGVIEAVAWRIPQLTGPISVFLNVRLLLLFLIFRRLVYPRFRWRLFSLILAVEVVLGMTGYFAGFREALIVGGLAIVERFDRHKLQHWVAICALLFSTFFLGILWNSIKGDVRSTYYDESQVASQTARLQRVGTLSSDWIQQDSASMTANMDQMVDRIWSIYFPALALSRVPEVLPYEDGAILWAALYHVIRPRLLFPDKDPLPSDSDKVVKYSGVWVAGADENTSVAFGYAIESYVDFGFPLMFLPIFVYGILMGMAYVWFLRSIRHRELAIGFVTVVFWLCLYLFERSWVMTLAFPGTLMLYFGGATFVVDRFLLKRNGPFKPARRLPVPLATPQIESGLE